MHFQRLKVYYVGLNIYITDIMGYCCDLLFITTLACQIADCLNENELSILAADLELLSEAIAARRSISNTCTNIPLNTTECSDEADEIC